MNVVPFSLTIPNDKSWCVKRRGLLRDEDTHLCLEFRVQDGLEKYFPGVTQQVRIPLTDLASVRFERGWLVFGGKIVLQAKRIATLEGAPGRMPGQVELHVAREHWAAAAKFVDDLHVPAVLAGQT